MRQLAFRLREMAPINFWLEQSLAEMNEWLDIMVKESRKKK